MLSRRLCALVQPSSCGDVRMSARCLAYIIKGCGYAVAFCLALYAYISLLLWIYATFGETLTFCAFIGSIIGFMLALYQFWDTDSS